ncbi:MAG: R3H domain-containing nucleic acid-binding protein [Candidatus Paceibacterota bacterium]|jgi:spoIIIJ-associated protein
MTKEQLKQIKKETEEFFKKTTFEVEVEVLPENEKTVPIRITAQDPQVLIGEGGQTLSEMQHLLKSILKKKIQEEFYINLDINGYKEKKEDYLREMVRSIADEVILTKRERELPPMPSYERRIVHMELSTREGVEAESVGEEPERRVVVKPKS